MSDQTQSAVVVEGTCPKCGGSFRSGAKFCGSCGSAAPSTPEPAITFCPNCGTRNESGARFCKNCGTALTVGTEHLAGTGVGGDTSSDSNKIATGICGILLGGLGIHKFILGYSRAGTIMLAATLCSLVGGLMTCGLLWPGIFAIQIIGLIEGIIYLTKSDEEFVRTYVNGRKEWF